MKKFLAVLFYGCCLALRLPAQEGWHEALRKMPLPRDVPINRDNCMSLLLNAFASNQVIAALVFLPAVSDDFYLINRDRPKLNLRADNILEALTALTNATALRVTFKRPMLLLHLDRDVLEPHLMIRNSATAQRLKRQHSLPHALWIDAHWERVQPKLQAALKMSVLPAGGSVEAWHFARHNLAAWNLTDWDLLAALSLTGKTAVSVQKNRIIFGLD